MGVLELQERGRNFMADLTTDVRTIKGIGEQRAKALEKLGITDPAEKALNFLH